MKRQDRLASVALVACVVGFAALMVPAMCLYPGGTWWDSTTRGYRFWENFLCDLEWRVALNGQPNDRAARLAQAAMVLLAMAFVPFWLAVTRHFDRPRLGAAVRTLGFASVLGTIAVILMPSDRFGVLHGIAVIVAGLPGLGAAALATTGLLLGEPRPRIAGWTGASMLVFALTDFVLYVSHLVAHAEGTWLTAAAQKIALLLLLAWMTAVAARSY
jgi:hypothetical protein